MDEELDFWVLDLFWSGLIHIYLKKVDFLKDALAMDEGGRNSVGWVLLLFVILSSPQNSPPGKRVKNVGEEEEEEDSYSNNQFQT